ncbi:carotenoid oxygenase family protein [Burkholderia sp. L27(2015)]|uniref:carotenoid oxygenase family protein n=1 Tax=Burkholderia sp. L27(2015) TaxID=1641858 RepID=UPI00131A805B|nr:carotenoid oxygenase family protein [Burkholderia sp. L27(2015)]
MSDFAPWSSGNPSLSGAYAPVFDERDDTDLTVEGEIPPSLRGVFMRNGPNPQFEPDDRYAYPFDGTGMIHAIYIENGRARYRNRWVLTQELLKERAAGQRIYNSSFSAAPHADLANTNIVYHAGRYLALYEGGVPYEVNRDIDTVGLFNYDGALPNFMSAHPKLDPATGELLSLAYDLNTSGLTYLRADKTGRIDRVVPFQAPWPAMVHDVAITERHVIAFICPFVFDRSHQGPPGSWQPDKGTMVAVIPRDARTAADVKWITGAPFFQFHTMNAFAEGNRIEVVAPWYDSFSLTARSNRLELHRLVIHTDTNTLEDQALDDQACEFSRINEAYLGRRARYGYVGLRDPRPGEATQAGAFEAMARYDLTTGQRVVHRFPAAMTVCEPVFVADSGGRSEEDGFIFTFAHDAGSAGGRFVILDARHLAGAPLAVVHLPRRVPAGLHGSWIPA